MQKAKFIKLNENFTCDICGKEVPKHKTSSRDHCNNCLYGKHVDINPGDRLNECKGTLEPIGIDITNSRTRIIYICKKCKEKRLCITAPDDNKDILINLSISSK